MDLTKLVETVSDGEHQIPQEFLELGGIDLLPMLRYETLLWFRNGQSYSDQKPVIPAYTGKGKLKALLSRAKIEESLKKAEVLIYDPHFKSVNLNGFEYNHLLDPFAEHYTGNGKHVVKTSLVWKDSLPTKNFSHPLRFVFKDTWVAHFMAGEWSKLDMDAKLNNTISQWRQATGATVNPEHFRNSLFRAMLSRYVFLKHLKDSMVERVIFECYYKPEVLGLIAAATTLDIQTVDIQHGKQGTHHLMYTHWKTVPKNGFNVLPTKFWNWGVESVNNIAKHSSERFVEAHRPTAVGYPWLDRCRDSVPFHLSADENQFLNRLNDFKTIVLVTLQPETVDNEGCLTEELTTEVLSSGTDDVFWLMRKHPTMKRVPAVLDRLVEKPNVDHTQASIIPLISLLNVATHHVTKFSSVAFEADYFGIPTYITGSIGKALFSNYLQQTKMYSNHDMDLGSFIRSNNLTSNSIQYFTSFKVPNS